MKEIELIKKRIGMSFAGLHGVQIDYKDIGDMFIYKLSAYLLGEQTQDIDIVYPLTWWDGFKVKYFPQWLLERYPPIFKHIYIDVDAVLPNFAVNLPDEPYIFLINKWEETRGEWE